MRTNSETRRILIIDDERPILMTLEALLSRHGYRTETATTATLGLRAMKTNPAALVLLDLQLPDADGLESSADGVLAWPVLLGHRLVDHGYVH